MREINFYATVIPPDSDTFSDWRKKCAAYLGSKLTNSLGRTKLNNFEGLGETKLTLSLAVGH